MIARFYEYYFYYKSRIRTIKYTLLLGCPRRLICWGRICIVNPTKINVGNDVSMNEGTYINGLGGVNIGNNVALSAGCKIISTSIDSSSISSMSHISEGIVIGDNVQIGANAIVLAGVEIGSNVIVGAGAVVTKDIDANSIVAGVPARLLSKIAVA